MVGMAIMNELDFTFGEIIVILIAMAGSYFLGHCDRRDGREKDQESRVKKHKTYSKYFFYIFVWMMIISGVIIYLSPKIVNYQGMHRRVADIETFLERICKDIPIRECHIFIDNNP